MPHIENYKSSIDTTVHCAYECEHYGAMKSGWNF